MNYLVKKLSNNVFEPVKITLLCEDGKLRARMLENGRDEFTIEKSMIYQGSYQSFNTIKIDTTELSVLETAGTVEEIILNY